MKPEDIKKLKKEKTLLEVKLRRLELAVNQETTHLRVLTQIPAISENHNILDSLDLSIFKLWDAVSRK